MKDFDELLVEVLQEDASTPPLAGFEGRIMARIRTDQPRQPLWRFVTWGAVAAGLPVCVVGLLVWPRSSPPVQHVKKARPIAALRLPERVAVEPTRNQQRSIARATISSPQERTGIVHEAKSLPKLDVFPTPSVASEPMRELAAISRHHAGEIVPALVESAEERKPPAPLKIEPIEIAKIEIAPLYPVKDMRPAKEEQGR